jgi:hypothetical protein
LANHQSPCLCEGGRCAPPASAFQQGFLGRGRISCVNTQTPRSCRAAPRHILVEVHLLMMRERIEAFQARRVAVDSVSVFLHKVRDQEVAREKIFQLASIVHTAHAKGRHSL